MRLSIPFLKKKKEQVYYFCLYITDSFLSGFIVDVHPDKEVVLADKKLPLTAGFDKLLEDTDALISDLELQSKVTVSKTIFFLHSTMIDPSSHDIKEPYKGYIKHISQELELEPMGYIDVKEAIEDYVKGRSIINCLIVELNKTELGLFIYKGGVLINSQYAVRTQDTAADINTALASIPGKQVIPSKMIIYGDQESSQVVTEIAQYNWNESIFVQHPTIEALKEIELHQALAHSFAKELNSGDTSENEAEQQKNAVQSQSFGFMFNEDVLTSGASRPVAVESPRREVSQSATKKSSAPGSAFFASMTSFFKSSGKNSGSHKALIMIFAGILLAVAVFFAYEYFFHKVKLKVYVQSKDVSEEIELKLPVTESANSDVAAILKHVTVLDLDEDKTTTGSREIGEKAKGKVVVHNFDNSERTLERGTEITYKTFVFTLDSSIKVASSSGVTSDGTKQSGKETVSVTASDIGDEYNLAKGTQFSIDSLAESLFVAIADETFSGGSKKKVNTVSKQDISSLESKVVKQAESESEKVLSASISNDELLIPDLSDVKISKATYSKELGEEADSVSVKASSDIEYYTVNKKSLVKELEAELLKEDSNEYELDEKTIDYSIKDINQVKDNATLTVLTKANLFKKINIEDLKKNITLKPVSSLTDRLKGRFPIEKVEVENVSVNIPFLNSWSPLFQKNIEIETTSK